ncbi:DUF1992 domain-containing protein [Planctomonas deserti]|uniref:DnaJ family domain-containing protein n=1 Tax=Planctomonas deserti TaxID=2144185 RepID=UPI000D345DB5|nr:DUF1992 domain-containing protein [Planctomonas deserti]
MAHRKDRGDARLSVARYQVDRLTEETSGEASAAAAEEEGDNAGQATMDQRAQFVEIAIQQAQRRGDFDDLPGAGKPLASLRQPYDPNWWIRQKIERENLTGLGPPALTLRQENRELDARLDATGSERVVREILDDFNARIVEARRQLQGGPPVVTPTRDVEEEVARWRERQAVRLREAREAREQEETAYAAMSWRERRRARRGR